MGQAILTDGAPVNALEYTKVGSMLPPFKYTEYSFDEKRKLKRLCILKLICYKDMKNRHIQNLIN